MKTASGYIRVSTREQAESGQSLQLQRQNIIDFIKGKKDWQFSEIYEDAGKSGANIKYRNEFQRMIEDAKAGKFNILVFTTYDRLARSAKDLLNIIDELKKLKIDIVSTKETFDTTSPSGELMILLLAGFAQFEHRTIKRRTQENRMDKWRENRTWLGQTPYGYSWNKKTHKLEIIAEEKEIFDRVVNMYLYQGMKYRDIAKQLNDEGIKPRRAKQWSDINIGNMFNNPIYTGETVLNKHIYEDGVNGSKRTNKLKAEEENIRFTAEPLLTKEKWNELQRMIQFNTSTKGRPDKDAELYWLRHVLYCGACGGKVNKVKGKVRKDGGYQRYYVCYYKRSGSKEIKYKNIYICPTHFIPALTLENYLWDEILHKFKPFAITKQTKEKLKNSRQKLLNELFNPEKYTKESERLAKAYNNLEAELQKERKHNEEIWDFAKSGYDRDKTKRKLEESDTRIKDLSSKMDDVQSEIEELKALKKDEENLSQFIETNRNAFNDIYEDIKRLGPDDRRRLIEGMLPNKKILVEFNPDPIDDDSKLTVDIELKINVEILKLLADEGKLRLKYKDGPEKVRSYNCLA